MMVSQPPPPRRPSALARCEFCAWSIQYTDDTVIAVAQFLRDKLVAHVKAEHGDRLPTGARPMIEVSKK